MSRRLLVVVVALLVPAASPAVAQEGFRDLDAGHPLRTQDASPLPLGEWEVEARLGGRIAEGGSGGDAGVELKVGPILNLEVGVELEGEFTDVEGGADGVGGFGAHALYGLARESWSWPTVGLRGDVGTPGIGEAGADDWTAGLDLLLTRSFGRIRLHGNAGRRFAAAADGGDAWRVGVALDYPIGLFSRSVMADVYAILPENGGDAETWLELGTRWQMTNSTVLDVGLGTRLDEWGEGRANVELGVGLSYAFGVAAFVSVPAYPEPGID